MDPDPDHDHNNIYTICRSLPTFASLSHSALKQAIKTSIETYLPELEAFDTALPQHFHRKSKPAWLEFTCATIHICNLLAGSCLSLRQAAAMMEHVDLLYRVDDFMESMVPAYGIVDMQVAFEVLGRCFEPYLNLDSSARNKLSHRGPRRIDSPVGALPPISNPIQFEQDLQDVIRRMHSYPICAASDQDRQWYSLELYDFLLAQLEQLEGALPQTVAVTPGEVHEWITNVGARSVGTKYMFAMFTCLISAVEDVEGVDEDGRRQSPWKTASSLYLAQEFAQQISVEFRVLNDVGGRVRDERDGTMSCCGLVAEGEDAELLKIAEYAAENSAMLLDRLARGSGDEERMRGLLGMFRGSVRVSGELYMVGEPNRGVV